jgi:two-component system, chemotaxis family, response regulator WspF
MRYGIAHPEARVREAIKRTMAMRANTECSWSLSLADEVLPHVQRESVDLLLLDVEFAGRAAERVQAVRTNPDVAVFLLANDPDAAMSTVYEALAYGALAVVYPPSVSPTGELSQASQLLSKLDRFASLLKVAPGAPLVTAASVRGKIIALGASTGGPQALMKILQGLPAPFSVPIILVQHIEGEFVEGLASWLAKQSGHEVVLAQRGDVPRAGRVYVADGAGHLVLLPNGQLTYLSAHASDVHVPSVDMLFKSLSENCPSGVAALLTGMGEDGAQGLLKMKQKGWKTFAQDQASSAVFGMPRAAIQIGAAVRIVDIDGMSHALQRALAQD